MHKHVESAQPFLRPFPEFDDVFDEPLGLHRKHLLPLVSVDASVAHEDLNFWLHFVTPIEPLLELDVGCFSYDHHDVYNSEGQYALRFENGKYTFAGDFNYFTYESGEIFKAFPDKKDQIEEDYRVRFESWERNRQAFLDYGRIGYSEFTPFDPETGSCGALIRQLGGEPKLGNWTAAGVPVNQSGTPF
ncbi:MAG: hypothetical protein CMJ78_02945 [Planctomycetaceae bacterium]|nr:hypothetical protein [Planctomycetaceae bacterium]